MCPSVSVHLVGGILDEVQHDILDESFAGPLEHPEYGTSTNNHSVSGTSWGIGNFHLESSLEDGLWNPELTTFLIEDGSGNCWQLVLQHVIQVNRSSTHQCRHPCKCQSWVTLFHWIQSSLLLAFLHGNNLPLDRLVESCGTSWLEFVQLGFSNLNSVFNIESFVADLPGDNVDKILALGDIKGIHTRLQLVSDSIPVITVGLDSWSGLLFVVVYCD